MRFSRRARWGFWGLRMAALVGLCLIAGASTAPAQDAGEPNFFQRLFGLPTPKPPEAPPPRKVRRSDYVPATKTRAPGAPGGAPVQANFHVQVVGDSMAVLAADGLTEAFADKGEIAVADNARDASGLVRADYFDWPKFAAEAAVAPDKADFVVIMLGINDLQPMRDGAEWLDTLSDRWRDRYGARVEAVVAPFVAAHIPVAWVGLPPMRAEKFNSLALRLNEIYRAQAEKAGAKFIDIFDAFTDQNGQYDAFGPNIDGQTVKLRVSDGIRFTKAGARKVAHFLESEIRRAYDKRNPVSDVAALPPDIEQAADDINAQIRREMGAPEPAPPGTPESANPGAAAPAPPILRPLAGPIEPLTARPTSPGGVLASLETHPLQEPAEVTRVLRAGEPNAPEAGRADDFGWPRP